MSSFVDLTVGLVVGYVLGHKGFPWAWEKIQAVYAWVKAKFVPA